MQHANFQILDANFQILDANFQILDANFQILGPKIHQLLMDFGTPGDMEGSCFGTGFVPMKPEFLLRVGGG